MLGDSPTIFGLMVTGKDHHHFPFAKLSVESFLNQTYINKIIVVINDGDYELAPIFKDKIREIRLGSRHRLGQLRNIALEQVPDDAVWLQWDDDDWRHPKSIETQYDWMMNRAALACVLRCQIQYAGCLNAAWIARRSLIAGTMMCRKRPIAYRNLRKHEDTVYAAEYAFRYGLRCWDNPPHYYLRLIHGHNTWGNNHFKLHKRRRDEWRIDKTSQAYLCEILPSYAFMKQ